MNDPINGNLGVSFWPLYSSRKGREDTRNKIDSEYRPELTGVTVRPSCLSPFCEVLPLLELAS